MTERLIEKLDRFGVKADIKEMTPEIRRFAMLVRNDMLQVWPKRDWVGLTDDEVSDFSREMVKGGSMNSEDEEFNRIEREAAMRKEAVAATVEKPMHPEIKKMYEDYFDKCFRASSAQREWVGLTDDEVSDFSREMVKGGKSVNWLSFAIEQRLKEKNNG